MSGYAVDLALSQAKALSYSTQQLNAALEEYADAKEAARLAKKFYDEFVLVFKVNYKWATLSVLDRDGMPKLSSTNDEARGRELSWAMSNDSEHGALLDDWDHAKARERVAELKIEQASNEYRTALVIVPLYTAIVGAMSGTTVDNAKASG